MFQDPDGFGNKKADTIKDFDSGEGDLILLDKDFFDLGKKIKLKTVTGKKAAKKQPIQKKTLSTMTRMIFPTTTIIVKKKDGVMVVYS